LGAEAHPDSSKGAISASRVSIFITGFRKAFSMHGMFPVCRQQQNL
jgi:hypothetical protein